MIWRHLEDCYGCPEVIEQAMLKRLDSFPRITNKDTYRLRDLGDRARGGQPHCRTAPSIQDKWISQRSRYKEDHNVYFPPFSFFVDFVCRQARSRNYPSFALTSPGNLNNTKADVANRMSNRTSVFVKKTEIMAAQPNQGGKLEQQVEPDKSTIHNKPHLLYKCRTFRSKHLNERKVHPKEKSVCFRCCASTKHVSRDCKTSV